MTKTVESPVPPDPQQRRVSRRAVVVGIAVGAIPVAGIGAFPRLQAQTPEITAATPHATPPAAKPPAGATPLASPMATPLATPEPPPLEIIADQQPVYDTEPRRGGSLRLQRQPADRFDFNPAAFRQDYQVFVSYLDPLLRPNPLTMEPEPWLAESWQVSADGLEIVLKLRPDVIWHDGTLLTAADVVFSLLVYRDDFDTGVGNFFTLMDDVEVIDQHEVRVTLAAPDPGWLFNAATQLIFPASQLEPFWNERPAGERSLTGFPWENQLPVGTGPWRVELVGEAGISFERNEDYWLEPPWYDRLELGWQPDRRDRIETWRAGDSDLIWPLRSEDVRLVDDIPARLYVAEAASVMFVAFNFANPTGLPRFFDDLRLRQALSLATNRERYADEVFHGFTNALAAGTVAQPWAHDAGTRSPRYDPDAALALLADAGWTDVNGDGTLENAGGVPFDITVIVRDDARRELIEVLRSVKADWAEIGVALRIQILPGDQFQERALRGLDYDLIAYAYDLYPGFTDFDLYGSTWDIRTNSMGWNPGGYANQDADMAIEAFLAATDVGPQKEALIDLQRAVNDDLFAIWLGFPSDLVLCAIDVDGFQPNKLWQTADTRQLWRTQQPRVVGDPLE